MPSENIEDINMQTNNVEMTETNFESENLVFEEKSQQNNKNLTFFEKIKLFAKQNLDYLVTGISIFFMLLIVLAVNSDLPFGNKSFLVSDSYEQVAVFFNHFFDVFEGKATLFYSNYFAKGVEMFSTLEYMYLNPFYLIAFLGGRQNIYLMMAFSYIFMLIFNGLIFVWFSRKYFKKINCFTRIIFALLYSFSGYINYGISFSTWIIYPALILIVVDRFINFMKTKKMTSFILSLVWYVVACYSVGISTMIVLVTLMICYIFYFENKSDRAKSLTDLFVVLAISALASLAILFPSVLAVLGTDRSSSFIKNLIGIPDTQLMVKIGVVFFDSVIVILNIYYFIKCNKKDKINKFLLFTLIFLYIPVIFDSVMKILCFSSYQCFSSRFYFLNEALIFGIAMLLFEKDMFAFKDCKTNTLSKLLVGFMLSLTIILMIVIEIFDFLKIGMNLKSAQYSDNGLTIIFMIVFAIFLFTLLVGYVLNLRNLFSKKALQKLITFFMIFSLLFSYAGLMGFAGEERDENVEQILAEANVVGNLKLSLDTYNYNNYNIRASEIRCSSVFTSLIAKETLKSYKYFGYVFGKTHINTKTGNLISDSILGLDYYLSIDEEDRPYLEFVANNGKYYLYRNKLATNGTFVIKNDFSFDDSISIYENFENLKNYFGIEGNLFEKANISKTIVEHNEEKYQDYVKVKIDYTAVNDGILYLDKDYTSKVDSSNETQYVINGNEYYSELKFLSSDETYSITMFLKKNKDNDEIEKLNCYFLNYNVAEQLLNKLKEKETKFEYTQNGYKVEAELDSDENLYIMVPNINGLHYNLNGKEIQVDNICKYMVKLSSTENLNVINVTYKYPHLLKWFAFAIIVLVMIALICVIYHYTKFKHLQFIIEWCMKIGVISIFIIVYVLGIILSIVWFFV